MDAELLDRLVVLQNVHAGLLVVVLSGRALGDTALRSGHQVREHIGEFLEVVRCGQRMLG